MLAKIWWVVLLPVPLSVWDYLKGAGGDGTLLQASLVTMRRLLVGYTIGLVARLPLGLLTARFKILRRHRWCTRAGLTDATQRLLGTTGTGLVWAN